MATESADGTEGPLSLPPPLEEWLDDRAASLGVSREELLVQVASAYRATSDLDGGVGSLADEADVTDLIETEVSTQLQDQRSDLAAVEDRLDAMEAGLDDDLESIRNRVLQLRDAVRNRAKTDHTHDDIARFDDRLDAVTSDHADLSEDVAELQTEVADATAKLETLARVLVDLTGDGEDATTERRRHLERLRTAASHRGVTEGTCHDCGGTVSIPLLSEPSCPHCDAELRDLTTTGIVFTRTVITGPEPADDAGGPAEGPADEGEPDG